jgi:type VI secretion system secreted protein VgrG
MPSHRNFISSTPSQLSEEFLDQACNGLSDLSDPLSGLAPWVERFASRFSANNRLVHIRFARNTESLVIGPDGVPYCVLVHSVNGTEAIGVGLRIEAVCLSDSEQLPLKALLGLPVSVWIDTDQAQPRCYNGFVSAAHRMGSDGGFAYYRLVIEDGLRLLRLRRNCRVFTEMNVLEITDEVMSEHLHNNPALMASLRMSTQYVRRGAGNGTSPPEHSSQTSDHYPARAFVMQYNESDFDFLCRLWAREGLAWCVWPGWSDESGNLTNTIADEPAHDITYAYTTPAHTIVLFDDVMALPAHDQSRICFHRASATEMADAVTAFEAQRQMVSGHVAVHSWDYKRADGVTAQQPTYDVFEGADPHRQTRYEQFSAEQGVSPATVLSASLEEYHHATAQWGALNESRHDEGASDHEASDGYANNIGTNFATNVSSDTDHHRLTTLAAEQVRAQAKHYAGKGSVRRLMAGAWFELVKEDDASSLNDDSDQQRFLVSAVRISARNNFRTPSSPLADAVNQKLVQSPVTSTSTASALQQQLSAENTGSMYANEFRCVRRGVPVAIPSNETPSVLCPLTAIVIGPHSETELNRVGEVYTDALGRIKVRFPFVRGQHSSAWVRVSQPWAGNGFGQVWLPRIGDEVLIAFIGGDPDKPIVTGSLYNGQHAPAQFSHAAQLPNDHAIGGIQSRMLSTPLNSENTTGFSLHQRHLTANACNELLMDDTPYQLRTRLASDYGHSALNQGYLIHPRHNAHGAPRGEGFELRTDAWGTLRAAQGLLLSTYTQQAAQGDALDSQRLIAQLKQQLQLGKALSDAAHHHNANDHTEGLRAANEQVDMLCGKPVRNKEGNANALGVHANNEKLDQGYSSAGASALAHTTLSYANYSSPIIAVTSPAGIVQATPESIQLAAGKELLSSTLGNTHINAQGNSTLTSGKSISLFSHQGAIKLYAAKEAIELQAQSNNIEANAQNDVVITSTKGTVHIAAAEAIRLSCGGATICIENGNIDIHAPGKISIRGKQHQFSGPAQHTTELPNFPPFEYQQLFSVRLDLLHYLGLGDTEKTVIEQAPYEVRTKDNRLLHKGTLMEQGKTDRIFTQQKERLECWLGDGKWHIVADSQESGAD